MSTLDLISLGLSPLPPESPSSCFPGESPTCPPSPKQPQGRRLEASEGRIPTVPLQHPGRKSMEVEKAENKRVK